MAQKFRLQFRRETSDELRSTRASIKRCGDTIERLANEDQPFRTFDLIVKAKATLCGLQQEEIDLEIKLENIEQGEYDEELAEDRAKAASVVKEKSQATRKKKKGSTPQIRPKPTYKNRPPSERFVSAREMARESERFERSCGKFPEKLADKLKKMPCNHGIIFNSIHFYGAKPPRAPIDTLVMQDKQGDKFYVRYLTPTEHIVYVKEGYGRNTREIFVSKTSHKRLATGL